MQMVRHSFTQSSAPGRASVITRRSAEASGKSDDALQQHVCIRIEIAETCECAAALYGSVMQRVSSSVAAVRDVTMHITRCTCCSSPERVRLAHAVCLAHTCCRCAGVSTSSRRRVLHLLSTGVTVPLISSRRGGSAMAASGERTASTLLCLRRAAEPDQSPHQAAGPSANAAAAVYTAGCPHAMQLVPTRRSRHPAIA